MTRGRQTVNPKVDQLMDQLVNEFGTRAVAHPRRRLSVPPGPLGRRLSFAQVEKGA